MAKKKTVKTVRNIVPKAKTLHDRVRADARRFEALQKNYIEQLGKSRKRHAHVEAYLLAWTMVEQVLLPSLIRFVAHALTLKNIPEVDKKHVSYSINYYYLLSHDMSLYENLCKANGDRNKIIHGLKTAEDIVTINRKARVATDYLLKNVTVLILKRLVRKSEVPVLVLYSKGWNDCRAEVLKSLDELRGEIN